MTCRGFRELQNAHLDGDLSQPQVAELHAHLLQCPECQRHAGMLRACGDLIVSDRRMPRLSADFADRLMASLPHRYAGRSAGERRRLMIRRFVQLGAMPAAAAAIALAVVGGSPFGRGTADTGWNGTPEVAGARVRITDAYPTEVDSVMSSVDSSWQELQQVPEHLRGIYGVPGAAKSRPRTTQPGSTFADQLLHPLFELFDPPIVDSSIDDDIERF